MLTPAETKSLVLTVAFLAAGAGIKAWKHAQVRIGPFPTSSESTAGASLDPRAINPNGADAAHTMDPDFADPTRAAFDSTGAATGASIDPKGSAGNSGESLPLSPSESASANAFPDSSPADEGPREELALSPVSRPSHGSRQAKAASARKSAPAGKILLNSASASELALIPGIGAKTAKAILDYRMAHGPFLDLQQLVNVKGIGEKKLERIAPSLVLSPMEDEEPTRQAMQAPLPRKPGK